MSPATNTPTVYGLLIGSPEITLDDLATACQMPHADTDRMAAGWLVVRFQWAVRMQAAHAFRIVKGCEVVIRSSRPPVFGHFTVTHHGRKPNGFTFIDGAELGKQRPRRVSSIDVTQVEVQPNFLRAFHGWTSSPDLNHMIAATVAGGMRPHDWNVLCDYLTDYPDLFVWENFCNRGFSMELFAEQIRKHAVDGTVACLPARTTAEIEHANRNPQTA